MTTVIFVNTEASCRFPVVLAAVEQGLRAHTHPLNHTLYLLPCYKFLHSVLKLLVYKLRFNHGRFYCKTPTIPCADFLPSCQTNVFLFFTFGLPAAPVFVIRSSVRSGARSGGGKLIVNLVMMNV